MEATLQNGMNGGTLLGAQVTQRWDHLPLTSMVPGLIPRHSISELSLLALSCGLRGFLQVLQFSSLHKTNPDSILAVLRGQTWVVWQQPLYVVNSATLRCVPHNSAAELQVGMISQHQFIFIFQREDHWIRCKEIGKRTHPQKLVHLHQSSPRAGNLDSLSFPPLSLFPRRFVSRKGTVHLLDTANNT